MKRNTYGFLTAVFALSMVCSHANPTGGSVVAGSASIGNPSAGTLQINQSTTTAIINWQTFSIGSGETTNFNYTGESANAAVLNRVTGGQTSVIGGTLSANEAVYLINGNGIVICPGGMVNANSFTASTRDISDCDFLHGKLHFTGSNSAGVKNSGTINALGGDVYLIGKTVDNKGTINAANGTVGLVSGDNVCLAQQNADGSTVTVNPSSSASAAPGKTAVNNTGTINAVSAELKAANGNLYALAINNGGTIRANTVTHQGGHIYLSSNCGNVVNSGTLDASATAAGGQGGSVSIQNNDGETTDSGTIKANGGQGGAGGNAEIISSQVTYTGNTDLTAPGGTEGTLTVGTNFVTIGASSESSDGVSNFTAEEIENTLATANLVFGTDHTDSPGNFRGSISVNSPLTWSTSSTLVFGRTGSVFLNGAITAPNGGLGIAADNITSGSADAMNPEGVMAGIVLNNFTLFAGTFFQNSPTLPTFQVSTPLVLGAGDFFLRSGGGAGTTEAPYQLVDEPGVQGIPTFPDGTVYVIDFGKLPAGPISVLFDSSSLLSFDSNTANSAPVLTDLTFNPKGPANGSSSVDDPEGDGGAINDGHGSKKGTNIASGSSTAGMPSQSRLLTAGSGISAVFNGGVFAVQPPPFVTQELNSILNLDSHGQLDGAAFGTH